MATSTAPFYPTEGAIGVNFNAVDSTQVWGLGEIKRGNDGTEWIYVKCNSVTITKHDVCVINENFVAEPITTTNGAAGHQVAVANGVAAVPGNYLWLNRGGSGTYVKVRAATLCVPDALLYTTATAGVLDDASTGNVAVEGIVITSTVGSVTAATGAIISFPRTTES